MIGKPKYNSCDKVMFKIKEDGEWIFLNGEIYIVDAYGTWEQSEEPSYDIMVEGSPMGVPCLYKHIRESLIVEGAKK